MLAAQAHVRSGDQRPLGAAASGQGPLLLGQWDSARVVSWLSMNGFDDFVDSFAQCHLNGDHLQNMKAQDLCRVGDQPAKRRKALIKAVARLKKQQASLVASSVAMRTEKRNRRQGIKSMFLRTGSEEDNGQPEPEAPVARQSSSVAMAVKQEAEERQPAAAAIRPLHHKNHHHHHHHHHHRHHTSDQEQHQEQDGYPFSLTNQQQQGSDSEWDSWDESDDDDDDDDEWDDPIYGNQDIVDNHVHKSNKEADQPIYGNQTIVDEVVADKARVTSAWAHAHSSSVAQPGAHQVQGQKEHVYVNDQAELAQLRDQKPSGVQLSSFAPDPDTYQNMRQCSDVNLEHSEGPSPIKPNMTAARQMPPPSAPAVSRPRSDSGSSGGSDGRRRLAVQPRRIDSKLKLTNLPSPATEPDDDEEPPVPLPRPSLMRRPPAATKPKPTVSPKPIPVAKPPSLPSTTRSAPPPRPQRPTAPPKPAQRTDNEERTVIARSAFAQRDVDDDAPTVFEPTHCTAATLFEDVVRDRRDSGDDDDGDLLSKLRNQVAMMDQLGLESKAIVNPHRLSLHHQPWYRPNLDRAATEAILSNEVHTGRFIVRESKSCPGAFTLSVLVDGDVRHVKVRDTPDGGVCLRANATEREIFSDVLEMIEAYCSVKLQLKGSIPFYLVPEAANDLSEA
eukprot:TRINITY_DN11808_c0_g2_i3.p1 TRINITY_DN11808_c0_g2~~TRINITY_DN11808_c0_g2_i3.p1  ORF type:complete len:672 (+),score=140.77 TRINITY_DN11808_c0_g2_i3:167-2182(+)